MTPEISSSGIELITSITEVSYFTPALMAATLDYMKIIDINQIKDIYTIERKDKECKILLDNLYKKKEIVTIYLP